MRLSQSPSAESLLNAYLRPETVEAFEASHWNEVLRLAWRWRLLGRLGLRLRDAGQFERIPFKARVRLESGILEAEARERGIRWETNRLARALSDTDVPVVLLKGGAYVMAGLPAGRGRTMSDLDILVARDRLPEVETALIGHGWESLEPGSYDDLYYRNWTHELPPMRHRDRKTELDVHHTILPPLGKLKPDPALLFEAARPIAGTRFLILSPEDLILHSAAHLFQDGQMDAGVRDLTDLDLLFRHFGSEEAGFWDRLVPRAELLHLTRPLHYAVRYTSRLVGTPFPTAVTAAVDAFGPSVSVAKAMDQITERALLPPGVDTHRWDIELANLLLLLRGHWLKMPLPILAQHLSYKSVRPLIQWWNGENDRD